MFPRQEDVATVELQGHVQPFVTLRTAAPQVVLVGRNMHASAGDPGDSGSILGSRRFPGEDNGNPLQCSRLEDPRDRGAWWATVHGAVEPDTT